MLFSLTGLFFVFSSFSSCQANSSLRSSQTVNTQTLFTTVNKQSSGFTLLDGDGFEDMIGLSRMTTASDFALIVFSNSCSACQTLIGYLKTYTEESHVVFYGLTYASYASIYTSLHASNPEIYPTVSGTPTIISYSSGTAVSVYTGVPASYSAFKANMDALFPKRNFYSLNALENKTGRFDADDTYPYDLSSPDSTAQLDSYIASNSDSAVLFTWKRCSDCASLFNDRLISYMNQNPGYSFYSFEVDYFRNRDLTDEEENQIWSSFASKYGFSDFKGGKVPTLVYFENGVPSSFSVYKNEGEATQNSDGSYSYLSAYSANVSKIKASGENALETLKKQAEEAEFQEFKDIYAKAGLN